jgi:5-methylcytosine-specific restriction protein B
MTTPEQVAWLQQIARQLSALTDEATLFDQLNALEPERVLQLLEQYRRVERRYSPINLLRYEVLNQLEEGRPPLTPADVELIRRHIEARDAFFFRKYGAPLAEALANAPATQAFRTYQQGGKLSYFRLFYRFFYRRRESLLVLGTLTELGQVMANQLGMPGARLRIGDFNNGNYSGGTHCWVVIQPGTGPDGLRLEIAPQALRCFGPDAAVSEHATWTEAWAALRGYARRFVPEVTSASPEAIPEAVAEPREAYTPVPYSFEQATADLFFPSEAFANWLAALQTKKNLLLQGPPGVGKTFVARRLAQVLTGRAEGPTFAFVQFHPSYAYEEFVQGYRPDGLGGFAVRPGLFYTFCARARQHPEQPHVLLIDELNRGNVSSIFGELLVLLEADKRGPTHAVQLLYAHESFFIPPNLYVIGTLNTADRSLTPLDFALRRRFALATLTPQFNEAFVAYLHQRGVPPERAQALRGAFADLNERIRSDRYLGAGFEIGHSYFVQPTTPVDDWLERILRLEIQPLLEAYWADDSSVAGQQIELLFRLLR